MKKIILSCLMASATLTASTYDSYEWTFVGISASTERDYREIGGDTKTFSTMLKVGMQTKEYRATLSYKTDFDDKQEFALQTDYLFDTFVLVESEFKPYIGVSLGSVKYDIDNERSTTFGLHTGLLMNVSEHIDLDIGFSHKRFRDSDNYKYQNSFMIGFNYFF